MISSDDIKSFAKVLGPGVMFAGTAIGVSHLVQSTSAGHQFGFTLIWAVIAANYFKYPFFEFGSRYANATGQSLISGYKKLGNAAFGTYFVITIGTMFFVTAAVGIVTGGFLSNLLKSTGLADWTVFRTTGILFVAVPLFLISGKFSWLLKVLKWMGLLLLICTLLVFAVSVPRLGQLSTDELFMPFEHTPANVAFLLALMGWMPTAVDLSVWNSIWTLERIKETGFKPSLKQTLFEFKLGYWISAVLALVFVFFGAVIIRPSGVEMSANAGEFAGSVVRVFSDTLGQGSFVLMAIAAFCIMLGTFIAIFDGFSRALIISLSMLSQRFNRQVEANDARHYGSLVVLLSAGAFALLSALVFNQNAGGGFRQMVNLATTLSFLVAPVIAIFNYRLVTSKEFPKDFRPGYWLKTQSLLGIVFLAGFTIYYLIF